MRHHTSPVRRSGVAIVVFAAALVVSWLAARQLAGPTIRRTHTESLFNQFDQAYADVIRAGNEPIASEASLRELIPTWRIDWNSCEFRDGMVFDPWGTAIQIRIDSPTVHLRSAGPDRQFGTPDDVAREIGKGPAE
jgi:hypothetical protein